ncbi:MAG: transcriptional regulator, partial [Jatrophihabitantaceae bacterium]
RYHVDDAQLARAVAQLNSVGELWDARLRRIKSLAEAIQRAKNE